MQQHISPTAKKKFQSMILTRYASNKRDLPWRKTIDPYAIIVSEVMSQQTQVSRVIPKWHQWMYDFPTVDVLAQATLIDVLAHWSGLGYNRRGKALWETGKQILVDMESGHPIALWMFGSVSKKLVIKSAKLSKKTQSHAQENSAPTAQEIVGYLRTLPGIGEYTASAVAAFAYNMDIAVVDINVTRVLRHTFQLPEGMSPADFRGVATVCIPQ
jgi:A/G-specific adenine glycosylase